MSDKTIENRVMDLEIRMAVAERNIDAVIHDVGEIKKNINKVLWGILGTIGLAVLNLLFH